MLKHKIFAVTLTAAALALSLSGCGVKSSPVKPDGSTYPGVYPSEPETKAPEAAIPSLSVEL